MRLRSIVLRSAPVSLIVHRNAPLYLLMRMYLLMRTRSVSQSLYRRSQGSSVARSLLPRLAFDTLLMANCIHSDGHSSHSPAVISALNPPDPELGGVDASYELAAGARNRASARSDVPAVGLPVVERPVAETLPKLALHTFWPGPCGRRWTRTTLSMFSGSVSIWSIMEGSICAIFTWPS